MPAEVYDQVVGGVKGSQSAADGFVARFAGKAVQGSRCRDLASL